MTARPLHSFVYPLKKLPPPAGSEGAGGELPLIMVAAVARRDPERRSCTRCCDLPPRRLGRLADCWISRSGSQWKTLQSRIGGAGVPSKQSRWLGWGLGGSETFRIQNFRSMLPNVNCRACRPGQMHGLDSHSPSASLIAYG